MGLTASQIRQDLNCFGGFGQQGYGYNIDILQEEIAYILGLDKPKSIILIGAGNLGRAVTMHMNFESKGFHLAGLFDSKESLVGQIVKNQPVRSMDTLDEFCREHLPKAAILCIPKEAAQKITEQLIKLDVKNFWNFSHYDVAVNHPDVKVENVHLGDSLTRLSYKMTNN
jgi:redox-sensing transcriptional repressor